MAKPALAAAGWSPEEAARYELAIIKGLAGDKRAQRVYYHKVRVVAEARARAQQQQVQLSGADTKAAASAGGRSEGAVRPTDVAAPRARRRKSEAQRLKSVQKLQHKHLQRRCEAAAAKAGGSSPRVLARVLACCGRFLEMLTSEGAERMARLRRAEAAEAKVGALVGPDLGGGADGLDVMRGALLAVAAAPQKHTTPSAPPPAPAWGPGGAGRPPVHHHPLGRVAPGWTAWAKPGATAVTNGKARAGEEQSGS